MSQRLKTGGKPPMVLHVIVGLATGGGEMMLLRLLRDAVGRGVEHRVLSLTDRGTLGDDFEAAGVPVLTLGMRSGWSAPGATARLLAHARRLRPDLVVGWMYHGNIAASVAGWACRAPVVWNILHTPGQLSAERPLTAWLIRAGAPVARTAAAVVYNSETSRCRHVALHYPNRLSRMFPSALDTDEFRPSKEARSRLRQELGLGPQSQLVGRVARFHPMKDFPGFLRAAHHLTPQNPRLHLVLAGRGVAAENPELAEEVQRLGLEDRAHLLGERRDAKELLAGLDLLCSSSAWGEGCPNVVAEAMACGIPCVVTDVGDSAALVGESGWAVPPADEVALAEALAEGLALGDEERCRMGEAARRRAVQVYSASRVFPRHQRLWRACLRRRAHGSKSAGARG